MTDGQKPKRTPRAAAQDHAPWLPVPYEPADVVAIQAVFAGRADEIQQKRAMKWITETAAGVYDLPFRPGGEDGRRDTDFACGRAFVGSQILKLNKLNAMNLRKQDG